LIVDNNHVAGRREIKVGALREGAWLVSAGLQAGDQVIVDGMQKVQPGSSVRIVAPETKNAAASSPGSAAAH
jgi:membrane fusion protein (multidrug efflux system)